LGGIGSDYGYGIAVDGSGNVYVTGTSSGSGWGCPVQGHGGATDTFVARLDSSGALIWNTFLGGAGWDGGPAIALGGSGNIYVAGRSNGTWGAPLLPHTFGTYDAFAARLDSSGNLAWNTFLGGSGGDNSRGIAVDSSGNIYLSGESSAGWGSPVRAFSPPSGNYDVFAARLNNAGGLIWNTFLGGSGHDRVSDNDRGNNIAVDGGGNVYVCGYSYATWGSPVRAYNPVGSYDAFAVRLDSSGNLIWNTFLGGSGNDHGYSTAVGGSGNIYVSGRSSADWGSPVRAYTAGASLVDAFAAGLDSSGALIWNTFLGGSELDSGYGIAIDGSDNAYVCGTSKAT